jgi:polysaccharide pyruvyl transferase WcaK-like protein
MPFNLNQKDAGRNRKIIYNSVGATGVSRVEGSEKEYLRKIMNEADFVSVRDTFSQEQLVRIGYQNPILAPDSATVMSSVISNDELNEKTSKTTLQLIDELGRDYLVFQISQAHVRGKEEEFAKQLSAISKQKKLPILFIAIGNAAGHNDSAGINQVTSLLDKDIHFETYLTGNLFDIMNIIRNASCYCGTSLHGLITSMSFGIPRVGLLPTLRKQVNYMKTWDLEHMPRGITPNELERSVDIAMSTSSDELQALGEKLTLCYMDNFKALSQLF